MKTKITIREDEWYPFFSIELDEKSEKEISKQKFNRLMKMQKAVVKFQKELSKL